MQSSETISSRVRRGEQDHHPGRRPPEPGAIAIEALTHRFDSLEVIRGLELSVASGEVIGVVGPSGCGKTTLLELLAGLREPSSGSLRVHRAPDAPGRLSHCAYMAQRDLLLPWLSAIDNAALALRNRGLDRAAAREQAAPLLERFGLGGFERSRPAELSGGMRQRVAFLRTLLAQKPVLLLDEPFGALDAITRGQMQEWLAAALDAEPRTVVLVTHDVEEALYLCDRVAILAPRPTRVLAELSPPDARARSRAEALAEPELTRLRAHALAILEGGAG